MTHNQCALPDILRSLAEAFGFVFMGIFPAALSSGEKQTVLLLGYPYTFYACSLIPAYYVAENEAFHKLNSLIARFPGASRAQRLSLPVRELALAHNAGSRLRNRLLAIPAHGSCIALFTLGVTAKETPFPTEKQVACRNCGACMRACPTGALSQDGFNASLCFRQRLSDPPDGIKQRLRQFIGCDACQRVCPCNPPPRPAPAHVLEAFSLDRILDGDLSAAHALIGTNFSGNKLRAQAAVLAANQNRSDLLPRIETLCLHSNSPLVRECAQWAICRLSSVRFVDGLLTAEAFMKD